MQLIRASEYRRMPWKNGGGETAEVAIAPPGAALELFDWRVSMARVETDGPFSGFAGVDRSLAILAGSGLRLHIEGREPLDITASSPPCSFPADVATTASLLGGPITDLNVMTRRGRFAHRLRREDVPASFELPLTASVTMIIGAAGAVRAHRGAEALSVEAGDTIVCGAAGVPVLLTSGGAASVYVVELMSG